MSAIITKFTVSIKIISFVPWFLSISMYLQANDSKKSNFEIKKQTNSGLEKKIGTFFWKKGDISVIDKYGPDGISRIIKILSSKAVNFQSGYLYHYAFIMLVGFSILLTYLIIY